jgi:two-component system response regulator HydG
MILEISMKPKLLVVDDDAGHRQMLQAVLADQGYAIETVADGNQAVGAVKGDFFDLILMDLKMPGLSGIEALEKILALNPKIPVIMMTAYASLATAIEALKKGAYDYLNKPLDIEELKLLVRRALRHHQLEEENLHLQRQIATRSRMDAIIGVSPPMQALFEKIGMAAPTEATVLISGESGTGKELVAAAIHNHSLRSSRPMVKVNCAALPETLLESELFGHTQGAFTGALRARKGRFQEAQGSSLFLDEIGELDRGTQAKLLRAIQEKEIQPLGMDGTITVDVRLIASSNKDLATEIECGNFREDLFYRLNVVPMELPPLRRRSEDIPLLADHFLKHYAAQNHSPVKEFSPRAMDALLRYAWPGNIRELENLIERTVILTRSDTITAADFPPPLWPEPPPDGGEVGRTPQGVAEGRSLKEVEKEMILQTLSDTNGNRTHAAKILGISRRTLQLKLKAYGAG